MAVKGVIKRPEIAREMGVDINNPDAVRAAVAALEYENGRLMSPTPEPEIMDKIRRKAGLFDKSEGGENVEQNTGVDNQEDTGGLFDDGTAEMSFKRAVKRGVSSIGGRARAIGEILGSSDKSLTDAKRILEEAKPKREIYDIDAAAAFVKDNLLNVSLENYNAETDELIVAKISQNCLDKMNSGKARAKTDNNRLHALALANIKELFEKSRLLEEHSDKNNSPDIEAINRYYAPLLLDGNVYAVKMTVKKIKNPKGNNLYSIEGIDVNRESDQVGYRGNGSDTTSSTVILGSDSVNDFIGNLRQVNKKIDEFAENNSRANFGATNRRAEIEKIPYGFNFLKSAWRLIPSAWAISVLVMFLSNMD